MDYLSKKINQNKKTKTITIIILSLFIIGFCLYETATSIIKPGFDTFLKGYLLSAISDDLGLREEDKEYIESQFTDEDNQIINDICKKYITMGCFEDLVDILKEYDEYNNEEKLNKQILQLLDEDDYNIIKDIYIKYYPSLSFKEE